MIIHNLRLQHFCQHRELNLNFVPGLNLIVGPNGSGKTNALRALQFLLTGDAGGNRNKEDDIYQGAGENDSLVTGRVSHAGATLDITRSLRPVSNQLIIGTQNWTRVGEINAEIFRRLGATEKQIKDYIFVGQKKVDEMFDQRPADRAASLAALFGLGQAESVWRALGEFVSHIEVPTTTLDEDALRRRLEALEDAMVDLDLELQALSLPEDVDTYRERQQAIIQAFNARLAAKAALDSVNCRLKTSEDCQEKAGEALKEITGDLVAIQEALEAARAPAVDAEKQMQQWRSYDAAEATRRQYNTQTLEFNKQPEPRAPEPPVELMLSTREQERLVELREAVVTARRNLKSLESSVDTCPQCGQKMPGAVDRQIHALKEKENLEKLEAAKLPLEGRFGAYQLFNTRLKEYEQAQSQWRNTRERLCETLRTLANFPEPATPREALQALIDERDDLQICEKELLEQQAAARADWRAYSSASAEIRKDFNVKILAYSEATETSDEDAREATACLSNLRDALKREADISARQARLLAEHDAVNEQINDVQRVKQQGQATRDAIAHLELVRNVFHRNEAPRIVSYTYIEAMLSEVNNALEIFDAPFRVEMDDSLGFIARFLDGIRVQPDRRLSIGERIVLAMAFRITVNSTFAGQVGVLVMDEPTAGLDEHNLGCLPRALERLRDLSHERGLQVLFVTHEPRITHLFDNTVELRAAQY